MFWNSRSRLFYNLVAEGWALRSFCHFLRLSDSTRPFSFPPTLPRSSCHSLDPHLGATVQFLLLSASETAHDPKAFPPVPARWPKKDNLIMNEVDERTPLLENDASKTDLIYERFSTSKKRLIVGIVSCGGLVPCESLSHFPDTLFVQ